MRAVEQKRRNMKIILTAVAWATVAVLALACLALNSLIILVFLLYCLRERENPFDHVKRWSYVNEGRHNDPLSEI